MIMIKNTTTPILKFPELLYLTISFFAKINSPQLLYFYFAYMTFYHFLFLNTTNTIVYYGSFLTILFKKQEEQKMKWIDNTLLTLAIIGCVNWGLIGFFRFDLVSFIFGDMTWISRIIYALVGLSGIYMLTFYGRIRSNMID